MSKTLDSRILDVFEELSPSEQRLADIVLEHQRDLASYSATELASLAGVSKATAARLFKRLGYKSFQEVRRQARSMRHWGSPLHTLLEATDKTKVDTNLLMHLNNDLTNVTRTFEALRGDRIDTAVDALVSAERIWVLGLRNSYSMAHYARFLLTLLKPDVRLIPAGGLSFAEEVVNMEAGDVLLAIGFRRRPRILQDLLQRAHRAGVMIIFVTDPSASQITKHADIVLRCHNRGAHFTDSYTAAMSLLNYLASAVAYRLGDAARKRVDGIDELHDALDAFTVMPKPQ